MKASIGTRSVKVVIVCMLLYSIIPLNAATPWLHVEGNKIKDPAGNVVVLRNSDWSLRCGEGEMGYFVKDKLYEKKNDNQLGLGFFNFVDFANFAGQWYQDDCGPSNMWCSNRVEK